MVANFSEYPTNAHPGVFAKISQTRGYSRARRSIRSVRPRAGGWVGACASGRVGALAALWPRVCESLYLSTPPPPPPHSQNRAPYDTIVRHQAPL